MFCVVFVCCVCDKLGVIRSMGRGGGRREVVFLPYDLVGLPS